MARVHELGLRTVYGLQIAHRLRGGAGNCSSCGSLRNRFHAAIISAAAGLLLSLIET